MDPRANPPANLHPLDRAAIERIVMPLLGRHGARLKLFGSRARGDARRASDIDLAIDAARPLPADEMAALRDAFEESSIPFRVDLVDRAAASPALRASIDREGVAWPA